MDLISRRQHNFQILKQSLPTSDPSFYSIKAHDFKRNCGSDRVYKINWLLPMLREFDCRCVACGDDSNGLELDHYFVPKVKGGAFLMTTTDGAAVNNAAPLCTPCNRKKHDGSLNLSDSATANLALSNLNLTNQLNNEFSKLDLIKSSISDLEEALSSTDIVLKNTAILFKNNHLDTSRFLNTVDEFCLAVKTPFLPIKVNFDLL